MQTIAFRIFKMYNNFMQPFSLKRREKKRKSGIIILFFSFFKNSRTVHDFTSKITKLFEI